MRPCQRLMILLSFFSIASLSSLAQVPKETPATKTAIDGPGTLALDNHGHLFVDEMYGNRVWRIDLRTGMILIVAGNGKLCCYKEGVKATEVSIESPVALAADSSGNLFIGDGEVVRKIDLRSGLISTVAGDGKSGGTVDGDPVISASFQRIVDLAINTKGEMFIADDLQGKIFKVEGKDRKVFRAAGTGKKGYDGDGGSALNATFQFIESIAFDLAGNLVIADSENCRIRRVDRLSGVINTIAVSGGPDECPPPLGTNPAFPSVSDLALSFSGEVYFLEPALDVVARVNPTSWTPLIVGVGSGVRGFAGDGGPAKAAQTDGLSGLAIDSAGNLFISDSRNNRVRRVDTRTKVITTIAGNGFPHIIHSEE